MTQLRNIFCILVVAVGLLSSCHSINSITKNPDIFYKFEVAKQQFAEGKYRNAALILDNILPAMRNTASGDEAMFLMGMCNYNVHDYDAASEVFKRYYNRSYPRGRYVDEARFYAAKSYCESTLPAKLDQSETIVAIKELQAAMESNPNSKYYDDMQTLLFQMQDKLVEKEYLSAKLYFDLGDYFLNCLQGGSNYEACVVTAKNAINDYPYSPRKEDFAILILRAKCQLADRSVEQKKYERYSDTVDEYYGFVNEFPQSKYLKDAKSIFEKAQKELRSKRLEKYANEQI